MLLQSGKQKKRKLNVSSTARSAKWLSTLPPSCRLTTAVRDCHHQHADPVSAVFDPLLIDRNVYSGTKHKTMLEARSGDGAIKSFPRMGVKAKLTTSPESLTGLQNKTFHCEICDVHVNSETQLKQVGWILLLSAEIILYIYYLYIIRKPTLKNITF